MYRVLTAILIFTTIAWFLYALRSKMELVKGSIKKLLSNSTESFIKLKHPKSLNLSDLLYSLKKLSYFIAVICVFLLGATGFATYIITGKPLSGFLLVLHVTVSPIFAIAMTLSILLSVNEKYSSATNRIRIRVCFWLVVILTLIIMSSIVLSMYPIFSTDAQDILLNLHLTSALLFFIIGIYQSYLLLTSSSKE